VRRWRYYRRNERTVVAALPLRVHDSDKLKFIKPHNSYNTADHLCHQTCRSDTEQRNINGEKNEENNHTYARAQQKATLTEKQTTAFIAVKLFVTNDI